jgi:uncharacterized phage protein gp47/JayE
MSSNEYGVRDDGEFNKKDIVAIRDDLETLVENNLGPEKSLRPNSPLQQLIDAFAVEIARQWDCAEDSYYASFFEDAEGEQLDKQLALAGFSRRPLRPAEGVVVFSRDSPASNNITIPEGTVVRVPETQTRPSIPFGTQESVTLFENETETSEVPIRGLAPWETAETLNDDQIGEATNVGAGEITEIVDAVSGIQNVTNPTPTGNLGREEFQNGRNRETDPELKLRYENTLAEGGTSTVPAIESYVFRASDLIKGVRVEEIRDSTEGYGPRVTVFAPELLNDDVIAQAIYESRGAGLESFGSETGQATTDDGRVRSENFERATEVTIEVQADLTTSELFPDDGIERITNSIIRFIGGDDLGGLLFPGLNIGQDVVFDQVKKRVLEIAGVVQADVGVGISGGSLSDSNITIDTFEVAMTDQTEITLTEV